MGIRTPNGIVSRLRVLVVEDEAGMADLLHRGLGDQDYTVTLARDGVEGLKIAKKNEFAAIVLDVSLPLLDGYSVASLLRAYGVGTPILMLTARDSVENIISGLDAGAEDYMTKPFSFLELLARLRALTRRSSTKPVSTRLQVADLLLDTSRREVVRAGVNASLTKTEYLLLEVLMRNAGHVVLRQEIIRAVWGSSDAIESSSLDVFVKALRTKIDSAQDRKLIHTVRGFGYKLAGSEA